MTQTLKQLCDAAREELGWDVPAQYASSTDPDGRQTYRLANRQGSALLQEDISWQALKTEATITLVASQQAYDLPDDYARMIPSTEWDQTMQKRVLGPRSPRMWARDEYGGVVFGLNWRYEIRGNQIVFQQAVNASDAGRLISYEYVSKNWATASDSTNKDSFTADTDTQRFDDDIFVEGLIWRLKKALGFPFEVELAEYNSRLAKLKARDEGMPDVNFIGPIDTLDPNIPETGYGG